MALNGCTKTFCIFVIFLCLQEIYGASVEKRNAESDLLEEVDLLLKIRAVTNLLRAEKEDMEGRGGGETTNPADRITHNEDVFFPNPPVEQMKTRDTICVVCEKFLAGSPDTSRRSVSKRFEDFDTFCNSSELINHCANDNQAGEWKRIYY